MSLKTIVDWINRRKHNSLVPKDLVQGSNDEHDCCVLGSWAAIDRVLPGEDSLPASLTALDQPWLGPSGWGSWWTLGGPWGPWWTHLSPAVAGAGGAGGLLDPHLHHFISPSAKDDMRQQMIMPGLSITTLAGPQSDNFGVFMNSALFPLLNEFSGDAGSAKQ